MLLRVSKVISLLAIPHSLLKFFYSSPKQKLFQKLLMLRMWYRIQALAEYHNEPLGRAWGKQGDSTSCKPCKERKPTSPSRELTY